MSKKMVEKALKRKFEFLVYRQEKLTPTNFTLVKAVVNGEKIHNDGELVEALKAGVTKWAQETTDGKDAYQYAGDDMNIGDVAGADLESILARCPDIYELSFESLDDAQNWVYDTPLCEYIETEG